MKTILKNDLAAMRAEIDSLDRAWLEILAERFRVTEQVGNYKVNSGMPLVDPAREAAQLEKIAAKAAELGVDPELACDVLRIIIDEVVKNHQRVKSKKFSTDITVV